MIKQVKLGAQVWAQDENVGTVEQVVVDPAERKPGYLVIRRGRVRSRQIVVPVDLVSDVSPEQVTLEVSANVLEEFPDYESIEQKGTYARSAVVGFPRPVATHTPISNNGYMALRKRAVPEDNVGVERGMQVVDATGARVGRVHGLILDGNSRSASHIVLRQVERLSSVYRLVPVDLVADVQEDRLWLHISSDHVQGLAIYEMDKGQLDN
jgi:sporulation protein YlmC with PRC-barrel domain